MFARQMLTDATRYILFGPVLGACIGFTQVLVAAQVWSAHGRPDFYFRDWAAVQRLAIFLSVGGLLVGVPFGAAVAAGEHLLRRRVWTAPAWACVLLTTSAVEWGIVEVEFARRELLPFFSAGASVGIAAGLQLVWSRPIETESVPPPDRLA